MTLSVVVSVGGQESSYEGTVKVLLPSGLSAHHPLPYSCSVVTEGITCDLPNPMSVGEEVRREKIKDGLKEIIRRAERGENQ